MIRIICELWPGGYRPTFSRRKRVLGEVLIANDLTGTRERGTYRIMLRRGAGKMRCTEVLDFPRKSSSVFQLLRWALNKLHEEKNLP